MAQQIGLPDKDKDHTLLHHDPVDYIKPVPTALITQAFYRGANRTTNQEIMKSVLLLSAFVLGCYAEVVSWEDKPSFCKDHDCPKYTVVSTNDVSID